MSMPRAATSVTIRNCALPARNLAMAILRADCKQSSQLNLIAMHLFLLAFTFCCDDCRSSKQRLAVTVNPPETCRGRTWSHCDARKAEKASSIVEIYCKRVHSSDLDE